MNINSLEFSLRATLNDYKSNSLTIDLAIKNIKQLFTNFLTDPDASNNQTLGARIIQDSIAELGHESAAPDS